jgi:nucleoside-diphosphate-sugar epimerase
MSYLVTGGTGFIGSAICKELMKSDHKVKIFDNNFRGSLSKFDALNNFEFIEGDIRDINSLKEAAYDVDTVIHAAFINGTRRFYETPYEVIDVGISGALNLVKSIDLNVIRRVCLISSSEVYQSPKTIPTPEDISLTIPDLTNPRYSYGGSKIASELILYYFCQLNNIDLQIIRPHNVYGPDMGEEHVIPELSKKLLHAKNTSQKIIEIQGTGKESRSFCYIDDFVAAFKLVLELPNFSKQETYNIGSEDEVSIEKIAILLANRLQVDINFEYKPGPKGGTSRRCPDISKLKKLGFKPKYDLDIGIEQYCKWLTFKDGQK